VRRHAALQLRQRRRRPRHADDAHRPGLGAPLQHPPAVLDVRGVRVGTARVAHLPVLLGVDRKKLSKRHGDTSVRDYARLGYLPEALVNFFALMGWYPEDGRELFTVPDLIERFRIEEMGKSAAVFDILKLNWMNVEYMQAAYRENPD